MKKFTITILALSAIAAIFAWLWFNNPLNALVKAGIENFGSKITGVSVTVGSVNLSPADGRGTLANLSLGNPDGYKSAHAFKAGHIEVAIKPASITEDVILIHKILIASPDINYETVNGISNFDAIQRNVERSLGSGQQTDKAGKKMIIESLVIRDIKVNYNGMMDLTLPDIELRNIGKKNGGATSAQVVKAIIRELNTRLAIALAKTAAIGAVGGVAIGIGMGLRSLLGD